MKRAETLANDADTRVAGNIIPTKTIRAIDKAFIGSTAKTAIDSARDQFSEPMDEFSIAARIRRIETSNRPRRAFLHLPGGVIDEGTAIQKPKLSEQHGTDEGHRRELLEVDLHREFILLLLHHEGHLTEARTWNYTARVPRFCPRELRPPRFARLSSDDPGGRSTGGAHCRRCASTASWREQVIPDVRLRLMQVAHKTQPHRSHSTFPERERARARARTRIRDALERAIPATNFPSRRRDLAADVLSH